MSMQMTSMSPLKSHGTPCRCHYGLCINMSKTWNTGKVWAESGSANSKLSHPHLKNVTFRSLQMEHVFLWRYVHVSIGIGLIVMVAKNGDHGREQFFFTAFNINNIKCSKEKLFPFNCLRVSNFLSCLFTLNSSIQIKSLLFWVNKNSRIKEMSKVR